MNEDLNNLTNKKNVTVKKSKIRFNILVALIIGVISFSFYEYQKNKIKPLEEYVDYDQIIPSSHSFINQYKWSTWQDSVRGKMAFDPKWMNMVPAEFIL